MTCSSQTPLVPAQAGIQGTDHIRRHFCAGSPLSRGRTGNPMDLPLSDFRRMEIEEFDTGKLLAHAARQAAERGYKNFPIIDVDSHQYERKSLGEPPAFRDAPVLRQPARSPRQANAKSVGMLPAGVGY